MYHMYVPCSYIRLLFSPYENIISKQYQRMNYTKFWTMESGYEDIYKNNYPKPSVKHVFIDRFDISALLYYNK